MRIPICLLALVASAWTVVAETPQPAAADTEEQAQAAPTPAPTEPAKPADATPPPPPPKYGGWVFSGLADMYTTYNSNSPLGNVNALQNFDLHSGVPRFSLGKFTIDKSDGVLGIHADVGLGETMRLIHATDVAAIDHKALRYMEQMYVVLKPKNAHGTEIDFGQFVTSAGAEVIESSSNWNYTRSLLFAWAIPYYHFGFKTTTPITKELTVGFQLVNGWNTVWGNHNLQNAGITLAYTKTKYTYSANYYVGKTDLGKNVGVRNLFDTTLLLTPNSKLNLYVNGDWGRDNRAGGGYDQWYGIAGAARYQVTKILAFAGRAEFFNDPTGFSTGLKQTLKEGTVTGEAKVNDHLVARLEFRHDSSNVPFFSRGGTQSPTSGMNTLTVGVVGLLGPLK